MQTYFLFLRVKDPLFEYLESETEKKRAEIENDGILSTKQVNTMANIGNNDDIITIKEVKIELNTNTLEFLKYLFIDGFNCI